MPECSYCFEKTLRYTSPAHGGWGMVRVGMLVPESIQLFIAPAACGRHGAISACMHGYKDRLSYYFLDEQDIVSGEYERQIFDAVSALLARRKTRPRAILIFVTCIDDLMGTDLEALTLELADRFSDVDFTFCHMNPLMNDSKLPPGLNIQQQIYRLLKPAQKQEDAINLIGNHVPIDRGSELYGYLESLGFHTINHISQCQSYEQFQQMAAARYNLLLSPFGIAAVKRMHKDLGIDWIDAQTSYDVSLVQETYRRIAEKTGRQSAFDFAGARQRATEEVARALDALGGRDIYVDSSAVLHPYELALALFRYGFHVKGVFAERPVGTEKDCLDALLQELPSLAICTPQHPQTIRRGDPVEAAAVGFEAGYITQSRYTMNLLGDETLYGYHGIEKFMRLLRKSCEAPVDLKKLIDDYGLVV